MFIVADDNPDVAYRISVGEVKDAEGNVIPNAKLTIEVDSDNEDAVKVNPAPDGKSGNVSFGAPGQANVIANVKDTNGKLLGTGSASFTVTTGDPASISGINLDFGGLTPA